MLDAADLDLASRDPAVPGLATVLDSDALVAELRAFSPAFEVSRMSPFYVHYKPARRCIVAFRMISTTSDTEMLAYADAYGPDADAKLPKARMLMQRGTSLLGHDALVIDRLGTALYLFPADRRLKALRRVADDEKLKKLLSRSLGRRVEILAGSAKHLRYKPERRYVCRLDLADGRREVVKFYDMHGYRAAKRTASAFSSCEALRLNSPAGFCDKRRVLVFDWVWGRSLDQVLFSGDETADFASAALERAGAALAEVHMQVPAQLEQRTLALENRRLTAQAETIGRLCPASRELADRLVAIIVERLEKTAPQMRGLHGDFNAQQVLVEDTLRTTFLDFDRAMLGHPAADLGSFLAHLEKEAQRGKLSTSKVELSADALIRGYRDLGMPPKADEIRIYTALGLFYLAAEPFRYREPNWPQRIEALLLRVMEILRASA